MKKVLILLAGMILLVSCKKEFTETGFDMIKDSNYRFETYTVQNIKIYSEKINKVFSQNQPLLNLGIYKQDAYGLNRSNAVVRFQLPQQAFESDHFMNADSILYVQIRVPFFAKKNEELSTDNDPVYDVDSIFGNLPIKLSVYYQNYYFFPYDPSSGFSSRVTFYSDYDFSTYKQDLLFQDNTFYPDLSYVVDTIPLSSNLDFEDDKGELVKDTLPPHLVIPLDTTFFRQKIFNFRGQPELSHPDYFANHFRGLYIECEPIGNDGVFMMMQNNVQLVIAYRYETTNDNGTPDDTSDDYPEKKYEKIILTRDIVVNTYQNTFYPGVQNKIDNPNITQGEDKIYVKGDAASMGVIELFNSQELYDLRNNDWLINQADLKLYVDETEMSSVPEDEHPPQLYLFKYPDNRIEDLSTRLENGFATDLNHVAAIYNGTMAEDTITHKKYYQFNITRYIKNILRKDSTNVKLGLRVVWDLKQFLTSTTSPDPDAFVPFGTVLQGNLSTDSPPELIIYYTKPEEN